MLCIVVHRRLRLFSNHIRHLCVATSCDYHCRCPDWARCSGGDLTAATHDLHRNRGFGYTAVHEAHQLPETHHLYYTGAITRQSAIGDLDPLDRTGLDQGEKS